jgi:hypothetical protein
MAQGKLLLGGGDLAGAIISRGAELRNSLMTE